MCQNRDEPFRSFFARVRGKADICSYSTNYTCECGKVNTVDFTEIITRDVVIAGIYDEDIRRRIMGINDLCKKSANDIVALVESEEMARDSVSNTHYLSSPSQSEPAPQASNSPAVTDVKRINKNEHLDERKKKVPCPQCKKLFYQFRKGCYGWNKTPHKMCIDCLWQQNESKGNGQGKQSGNSLSLVQIGSVSWNSRDRRRGDNHQLQHPHEIAPIYSYHTTFSQKGNGEKWTLCNTQE